MTVKVPLGGGNEDSGVECESPLPWVVALCPEIQFLHHSLCVSFLICKTEITLSTSLNCSEGFARLSTCFTRSAGQMLVTSHCKVQGGLKPERPVRIAIREGLNLWGSQVAVLP